METIIDTFYNRVIPGVLSGEVLCGIKVRIIANVLFKERNKLFKAKSPVQNLYIPTLVINDKERLEKAIIHYGLIMDNFAFSGKHTIGKDELPAYYIACAIANMGEKDYANPEEYFEKLCYIHENNPIQEHTENYGFVDSLNGQLSIQFRNEYPNQECPFI